MNPRSMKERRCHTRVLTEVPIHYRPAQASASTETTEQAMTTTLSHGGLSFYSTRTIPLGTRLAFAILLPHQGGDEIVEVEGEVVRKVSDMKGPHVVEYGIKFLGTETLDALNQFMKSIDVVPILRTALERGTSAVYLVVSRPALGRVNSSLVPLCDDILSAKAIERLVFGMLTPSEREELRELKELSIPLDIPDLGLWRIDVHYQQGVVEATYRPTGRHAPGLEELGLPEAIQELLHADTGLILVTGQTGKSIGTAMAAMVDIICGQSVKVIVTIEEQVEYAHEQGESIVKQRELGRDVLSYADGIQSAMRQGAHVIVVDLVQDAQTMRAICRAVETGHLVLAVVSSRTALDAMYHVASFFTPELQDCERYRLSVALQYS